MFGLFRRDPAKKLEAQHRQLLEQARDLQRKGDIQGFATLSAKAEEVAKKIEALKNSS